MQRLLNPQSIAVIGGGAWCAQVIAQAKEFGFQGGIWPVHPKADQIAGTPCFRTLQDLPAAPDASFVGVNRHLTVDIVGQLSAMQAGGAVCFASGFAEAATEDPGSADLQNKLVQAADEMLILGPNCYGFINALDGALLWPDQHGCSRVDKGVAVLTQSSNIAINLTMQQRALPIAYAVTCGNMAQTSQAQIANALLDDLRVTAIGLHIEGFGNLREWEALAGKAYEKNVPLVAIKVGASDQAQQATISHTASLAGSDAGGQAVLDRLGIARVRTLPDLLETLKLLHCVGPTRSNNIASISCSGGEASLIADMAVTRDVIFPPLTPAQKERLADVLGPMVSLGNPLDYHTYIWRNQDAMSQAWAGMTGEDIAMTLSIVDYPTTDPADWTCATGAALDVHAATRAPFGVVASLPELMPLDVAQQLMDGGVVPFMGLSEALAAVEAAAKCKAPNAIPICLPGTEKAIRTLTEETAKAALAAHGIAVPQSWSDVNDIPATVQGPFAVKGTGLAHKSEANAVRLNIPRAQITETANEIGTPGILIEEMITEGVAELLIGVTRDAAHGFVLTIGAGGILTEVMRDCRSLLLPIAGDDIASALNDLQITLLLRGYRGKPAAHIDSIIAAIIALQSYVLANADTVTEVEVNPLICTPTRAVAADALIRKA